MEAVKWLEAKKILGSFAYDRKKRITFCVGGRPHHKKKYPPPQKPFATICKTAYISLTTLAPSLWTS